MPKLPKSFHVTDYLDIFRMLFDDYHIGVTVVDRAGVIVYYNDAQAALDDVNRSTATGQTICELYNFSRSDSPTMRVLDTGQPIADHVHFYRTRKGKLVNAAFDSYPLYRGASCIGAICFIQGYSQMGRMIASSYEDYAAQAAEAEPVRKSGVQTPDGVRYSFGDLVGESTALAHASRLAEQASASVSPIMLVGETGVGKEIFAQSVHRASPHSGGPYTAVNCSAMPETLLEGILFGTTKGAFTGAVTRAGLFEISQGGTLFLDEIDSMPVGLQSKLLRVLQEKRVRRIGDARERTLDVRIVSSVSRNPMEQVAAGLLRPDFYYRLGVVRVFIPPLRERMEDLHPLTQHFLRKHCASLGIPIPLLTPEAMGALYSHAWPGNVRELEHTVEAALNLLGGARTISLKLLADACPDIFTGAEGRLSKTTPWLAYQAGQQDPHAENTFERRGGHAPMTPHSVSPAEMMESYGGFKPGQPEEAKGLGLRERKQALEADALRAALQRSAGNMALAARLMGISPQLLQYKTKKYGIVAAHYRPKAL